MSTLYLAIALSYLAIGTLIALIYVFVLRRRFAGQLWGAVIVAVIGAYAGGLVEFIFHDIIARLSSIAGVLNIFPPIISAAVLLSIFAILSERKDEYED